MEALFEHSETVKLDPSPGFVVKTRIIEGQGDHVYATKVFINICHESRVPKPTVDFDPALVFPMIVRNEWEIPIIVSLEKRAVDKKGVPSFVYDCCINSECFRWVQVSHDLRMILVEWALESVEMMHELVLEREYALPKMMCKGELSATEITEEDLKNGLQKKLLELKQNETAGLIEELRGGDPEEGPEALPDLTDIEGKRSRPLIEEIGEMSLEEVPGHVSKGTRNGNDQKDDGNPKDSQKNAKPDSEQEDALPVRYRYRVHREQREPYCYVLFESKQLTKHVSVSFKSDEKDDNWLVTIKNDDPARFLEARNRLDIPMPKPYKPVRSLLLEERGQLYIFCKQEE